MDIRLYKLGNQKSFVDLSDFGEKGKIIPAGITIDQSDNLYVAMLNGGKILRCNAR